MKLNIIITESTNCFRKKFYCLLVHLTKNYIYLSWFCLRIKIFFDLDKRLRSLVHDYGFYIHVNCIILYLLTMRLMILKLLPNICYFCNLRHVNCLQKVDEIRYGFDLSFTLIIIHEYISSTS